jgi:selenide, water dikinase
MKDSNLIVGIETSDDAAVYKLNEDTALIQTLDFFTPVVDDPFVFGQIAATNSLSDIYAMGGKPTVALNIVCFPTCLPMEVLGEILKGGAQKVLEAGAVVVGGHSVDDNEPKYGLSVTGTVHPSKVLRNYGCKEGDLLILTKPLGTGIINTAIKGGVASEEAYNKAVEVMTELNKYAAEIITQYDVNACTDITGFGIMGHGYEMASASGMSLKLYKNRIPFISEAKEYASMGLVPAGSYNNRKYLEGKYSINNVEDWLMDILFDPQTSGGLLVSCSESTAAAILEKGANLKFKPVVIGEVIERGKDIDIIVE